MDPTIYANPRWFVPQPVFGYLGDVSTESAPHAAIKRSADEFNVAEQPQSFPRCTTCCETDLPADFITSDNLKKLRLTAVTVVKSRMTTYTVRQRMAELLGIPVHQITFAGLKDAMHTAQLMVISGVDFDEVVKHCQPKPLTQQASWFMKDPRPVDFTLRRGNLRGNFFTIKVHVPGMGSDQIREYLDPLFTHLQEHEYLFPNAYGRQRLGRRQNLLPIAVDFLRDPQAGIKRFLTETSAAESEEATALRRSLAESWQRAETAAGPTGSVAEQHFCFDAMRCDLAEKVKKNGEMRPKHEVYNLTIEYQIVCSTLRYMDFDLVIADLADEFSLWIGSYQSFWFNQVLGKVIKGDIRLGYQGKRRDPSRGRLSDQHSPGIPLLTAEPQSLRFYRRHCAEAIPDAVNDVVKRLFLAPRYTLVEVKVNDGVKDDEVNQELARLLRLRPGQILSLGCDSRDGTIQRKLIRDLACEQFRVRMTGKPSRTQNINDITASALTFDMESVSNGGAKQFVVSHLEGAGLNQQQRAELTKQLQSLVKDRKLSAYRGPWRRSFVPLRELSYQFEDQAVTLQFLLPSGAYATTILGILFNLDGDDREDEGGDEDE